MVKILIINFKKIIILLVILLVILVLAGTSIYIIFNYFPSKITVPTKPNNVPESAIWYGGPDGGVWINVSKYNKNDNSFYCRVYSDSTGIVRDEGWFIYDYSDTINLDVLKDTIMGYYGGDVIILNEIGPDGNYKVLKKVDKAE